MSRKRPRPTDHDNVSSSNEEDSTEQGDGTLGAIAARLAQARQERRTAYEQRLSHAQPDRTHRRNRRQQQQQPPAPPRGADAVAAALAPPPVPSDDDDGDDNGDHNNDDDDDAVDEDAPLLFGELSDEEEAYTMAAEDEARLAEEPDFFDYDDPEDAHAAADHDPRSCFGCRYVGERRPGQNMAALERLIANAQDGLMTSDWNEHFRAISHEYETNIRQPANKRRKKGQLPLPAWGASQVRRHILRDSKDPMVRQLRTINEMDRLGTMIFQEDLVRSRRNARRPDGQMRRTLDDKALDKYCKIKRLQLEYERWDARKSPFYNADRHVSTRNLPNPTIDTTHKHLFLEEYNGRTLDTYFEKRNQALHAAANSNGRGR